jgi:hypothetical protein
VSPGRRRLVAQLRRELAEARADIARLLIGNAALEARALDAELERDDLAERVAYVEAKAMRQPGTCRDRAQCLSNTDAADKWRRTNGRTA